MSLSHICRHMCLSIYTRTEWMKTLLSMRSRSVHFRSGYSCTHLCSDPFFKTYSHSAEVSFFFYTLFSRLFRKSKKNITESQTLVLTRRVSVAGLLKALLSFSPDERQCSVSITFPVFSNSKYYLSAAVGGACVRVHASVRVKMWTHGNA